MNIEMNSRPEALEGNIGDSVNSQANEALRNEAHESQIGTSNQSTSKPEPDFLDFGDHSAEEDADKRGPVYTIHRDGTISLGRVKSEPID